MSSVGNFLETVYDVLFAPKQALKSIAERRLFGQAIILVFVSLLLFPWASYTGEKDFLDYPASWAALAVFWFVAWFLGAAVLSIVAELFGGRGSAVGLFAAIGFSVLPRIVVMPFWVAVSFLPEQPKLITTGLIGISVFFWTFFLNIEAISSSHNISFGRSLLTFFTSAFLIAAAVFAVTIFTGAALFETQFKLP